MSNPAYIGRFAPTPSGPLHLGSLMSATCSYLQAKANKGKWLVRIEDVDTPRVVKGMASKHLKQLESFGFKWDEPVLYQSERFNHYKELISQLVQSNMIYACECSRKQIKERASSSDTGLIYPQTCRSKKLSFKDHSLRFKTQKADITFIDHVYGAQQTNIQNLSSDWVIQRRDGVIAYHLAVVADDSSQGITEVVRGFDILPLTTLHIDLQHSLKLKEPNYCHHPLIVKGITKLSKQNQAKALSENAKIETLNLVLTALGQKTIKTDQIEIFWLTAIKQWDVNKIPQSHYDITEPSA